MTLKKNSLKRQAGFTLLELMVVIVILGVLASMVVPNLMGNKEKADIQKATSDIVALEGSLDMYKLDNHRYPTTEQGLKALLKTVVIGVVLYTAIQGLVPVLMTAGGLSLSTIIGVGSGGVQKLVVWAVALEAERPRRGVPVLVAVEQDASGNAWELAKSYAKAIGGQPSALAIVMMMGSRISVRTVLDVVSRWLYIITAMITVYDTPNGTPLRSMPPSR